MNNDAWCKSGLQDVSANFFLDPTKPCQTRPKSRNSKGGPYTKNDRFGRRNEVYRLHLEYGYSARKIAGMMKVNRNTINEDLRYAYRNMAMDWDNLDTGSLIMKHYYRQESHRTRLREKLDKTKNESDRIILEKLIMEMDYRMPLLLSKIHDSHERVFDDLIRYWNVYAEKNNLELGLVASREITKVSKPTQEKIRKLITEDRKPSIKIESRNSRHDTKPRNDGEKP
jgi:hypothetical protein